MRRRFIELTLITALAVSLGYSLSSSQAIGYPAGPVISTGTNPVFSSGGSFDISAGSAASIEALSAPEDQELIITDLVLDAGTDDANCIEHWRVDFTIPGATLASTTVSPRFRRVSDYGYNNDHNFGQASHLRMQSGLRVPAGTSAQLEATSILHAGCGGRSGQIVWTASGYYAQP